MPTRFAVFSRPRSRIKRVPPCTSCWWLRGSVRHFHPDRAPMWGVLADAISRFIPDLRNVLYLSFSLSDPTRLEGLLTGAGFRDIRVEHETCGEITESFDDYWAPIEAGIGSIPQSYLMLSDVDRRSVREEVRAQLSQFESNGRLFMSVEMLIGRGRA